MDQNTKKKEAAKKAFEFILPFLNEDSVIGIGTGSTTNFFIDELILRQCGYSDFEKYRLSDEELIRDFFIPDEIAETVPTKTKSVYK